MSRKGYCENCGYYEAPMGWGGDVCLINERVARENPAYGVTERCPFWHHRSEEDPPCYRERDGDEWWCVHEANTACQWNDGQGGCLHEHPSSPAPLMEPEE